MQTPAFGNGVVPPTSSSNTPRIRMCRLPNVQGQPNKKLEKNERKWM